MARNAEKAQAMLNRLVQGRKDALKGAEQKRPFLATEVDDLPECMRWRQQIIREITKEVAQIQNGALGEHKIRDLNDHINKLIREKSHWERQIKILGGPDFAATAPKITDADGRQAVGADGYKYFGAARELPGVMELFAKTGETQVKRKRHDLHKCIDADYYGYRDDDDGMLEALEAKAEKKARLAAEQHWTKNEREVKQARYAAMGLEVPEDEEDPTIARADTSNSDDLFRAHVPLPSTNVIEKLLVEKRKKEILAKYVKKAEQSKA